MSRFTDKGYFVKENAPIYLTLDMKRTAEWFENVLGWYSNIVEKDKEGNGCYGVVFDMLPEVEAVHLAPFTGFQMFKGKPEERVISFIWTITVLLSTYQKNKLHLGHSPQGRYPNMVFVSKLSHQFY